VSIVAQARLSALVDRLSGRGDVRGENLLRHGLGYCLTYLTFLAQGLADFEEANALYLDRADRWNARIAAIPSGTSVDLSPDELQMFNESTAAMRLVQFRIETFYLFAKILLDRIADVVLVAFDMPRQRFGSSHTKVLKRLRDGWARRWPRAAEFRQHVGELATTVVAFRAEVLEHRAEFRGVVAIAIGADRQVRVSTGGILYPEPTDILEPHTTENLYDLATRLERYIDCVATFIEANSGRSILHP